jgi:DNA-binding response OmpR family regulator
MTHPRAPRILAVEDEPDIARLYQLLLGAAGYRVEIAGSLAAARRALGRPGGPGLMVLDIGLPDGDGAEFCREVKRAQPALPVIVVSALPEALTRAATSGADRVLPKPFDPDQLEAMVRQLAIRPGPCGRPPGTARTKRPVRRHDSADGPCNLKETPGKGMLARRPA